MKIPIVIAASILIMIITFAGAASPQEDSSQVEQCRADLATWSHNFDFTDTARADLQLTYAQLKDRNNEAGRCGAMDDKEPYHSSAGILQSRYADQMNQRLNDFLVRHDMMSQFQKEDSNGLR